MTFNEAIALQPQWVQLWLNCMLVGVFILPLSLLIWKQSRITGVIVIVVTLIAGFLTDLMFQKMGYVKLLGLPHIVFWTPMAIYLFQKLKRDDIPKYARWIIMVILATITISLLFDYTDVARYLLGERTPGV